MPLDIAAVQASLAAAGLDGWLLYDFHGSNPIAQSLAGLIHAAKMTTRRWFYYIPANGEPRGLVHAIERHNLDHLPGTMRPYAGRAFARRRPGCAPGRRLAHRHGVLAWRQHSLSLARGRRDAGVGAAAGCRGRVVGRPGAAVRGSVDAGADRHPRGRLGCPLPHQGSGARRAAAGGRRRPDDHRIRPAAADGGLVCRGRAGQLRPAGRRRHGQCRQPALLADRLVTSADRTRSARAS